MLNRKLLIALILSLAPSLAFGQGRYEAIFLKPLPAGGVTAYSGTASVCQPLTTTAATTDNVNVVGMTASGIAL